MNNNNTNTTEFIEGDPIPYTRVNILSQYIRDTYDEIVNNDGLQYDYSLPAREGTNKVILRKLRLALLEYKEEFTEVPNFAQKLRAMCTNHFQNKRAVARRPPAEQASINRRHRRRSRKEKKLTRRRRMLARHRALLEQEFPAAGMDILLDNKYMSDEESDDEHPLTSPLSVLRPSYRSGNVNWFLEKLDQLHTTSVRGRRHVRNRIPRSVTLVERPVPEELPRWMKQ